MPSTSCAIYSCIDLNANRIPPNAPRTSVRSAFQLFAVALGAASLAACAQQSAVIQKAPMLERNRMTSVPTNRRVTVSGKLASGRNVAERQIASHGVASFYTEGTQTANGEKFDTLQLTAAHRSLPFGTRLRVTNPRYWTIRHSSGQ
jgi:rare lipoprotein A